MNKINELLNIENDMDFVFNNLRKEDLIFIVNDYANMKNIIKRKTKRYFQTEKGRQNNRENQKRYYYRKDNKYHPIYNPNGKKKVKVPT